ncbi:MAG: DUF4254 domain-containing protein [Parvicellaceae bacterium]|tara:strand:+ start:66 stop:671 length:606 start_codon:yes stop_codon:yes gene_type:complete
MKALLCNNIFNDVILKYHEKDDIDFEYKNPFKTKTLEYLLFEKCWIDTVQWHLEDIIRKPNLSPKIALEIKKRIDTSNQNRTDIVEKIDDYYFNIFKTIKTQNNKINTESPGWVVDRMSILCLKIYHMNEQILRENVSEDHIENCNKKLMILNTQQKDLSNSFDELLEDYEKGIKIIKVYRQMKMYNDSSLNPELYQKSNI